MSAGDRKLHLGHRGEQGTLSLLGQAVQHPAGARDEQGGHGCLHGCLGWAACQCIDSLLQEDGRRQACSAQAIQWP